MDAAIAVLKWMNVHKTEGQNRRCNYRIEILTRPVLEGDQALDQRSKVIRPGSDMIRQRHTRIPIMLAYKAAFASEAEPHKPGIANHDTLEPKQFFQIERSATRVADGTAPALDTVANAIREMIDGQGAWANIPSKSNRKDPICFSPHLYKARNLVERFFNKIKYFRRIATRYDKLAANYMA